MKLLNRFNTWLNSFPWINACGHAEVEEGVPCRCRLTWVAMYVFALSIMVRFLIKELR